jgi:predicted ribosome quality control (RQC) complex YloA/Tae2 family protein
LIKGFDLQKKEFTSFDVAVVVRELREAILNSRVINVYQLNGRTLLFKLRGSSENAFMLVLESGKRLHLTSYALEKPLVPPAFCMALRKNLRGSWLTGVEQYEFERVVVFHFKSKIGVFKLVLELFGEGNIILVDGENKILQALHYKRMRDRNILRGEVFRFAPPSGQNPVKISKQTFFEGLRGCGDVEVVRALARFLGVGGIYAEEVLLRLGIDKTTRCNTLEAFQIESIYNCLQGLISQVSMGKLEPNIVLDESGEFFDVTPLRLKRYEGLKQQAYGSFNEALDEFYAKITVLEKAEAGEKGDALRREAKRLGRIIAEQEKALKEAEQSAKRYKQIGDAIYMHSGELQTLLDTFLEGRKTGKEWNEIVSEISVGKRQGLKPHLFFESFDEQRRTVNVCVDGLRFGLDLQKDLFANAAKFYERAKLAKRKLEGAKAALEETRKKIEEAEGKLREAEALKHVKPAKALEEFAKRKVKSKKWFEKFRWFISSDGFLVVAGKDATSNEVLIKKYTKPGDIVFHADIVGAPFVVVKTEDKQPSEQCLREAAEFAAAFSRGWRKSFTSIDVYWVIPEQLSKAGGSGEYVPHGAFVVSGKRNWMRGIPLRTAIGAIFEGENGEITFVGGAVDAVKAKTKTYVTIVPGDVSGKELLKQVLKKLAEKMPKEQREKVLGASVEKIREFVPYGKGEVLLE